MPNPKCLYFVPLVVALSALSVLGQETPPPDQVPLAPEAPSQATAPGRFRLGPFYLTPTIRFGNFQLDTNVFYTPTDRKTDLTGSVRPGLDVTLPFLQHFRLIGSGWLDGVYFVRTDSLRRLNGGGGGRLEWRSQRFLAGGGRFYSRSFTRPQYEVDKRVELGQWTTNGEVEVNAGRLVIRTAGSIDRILPDAGQTFRGVDIRKALAREVYRVTFGLRYRLTPKTSFVLESDYQADRFLEDPGRDADSDRFYGGFQLESRTRISGRAVAGVRWFRPRKSNPDAEQFLPYAELQLTYHVGPRTRITAMHSRDLHYSVFPTLEGASTFQAASYSLGLDKDLWGHINLRLNGGYGNMLTDHPVVIEASQGTTSRTAVREDKIWQGGADLGYQFRFRLRIGVAATYTQRRSTFSDFGIQGLLVGATVTYNPD